MSDLDGARALVTGGARGIGLSIGRHLAARGARVHVADLDGDGARTAARDLGGVGVELDVRDRAAFADCVRDLEQQEGPVDVLVNNAGIMLLGPVEEHGELADRRQVDVNVHGVLNGMLAVLPWMTGRNRGHVVNIASVAGRIGVPWSATYAATKHAVIGLTEAVRQEHIDSGVRFTYVMPAIVDTELTAGTRRLRWPPPLRPDQVAQATVRAILRDEVDVYVPRVTRLAVVLPALLPRRVYESMGRLFGIADVFEHTDDGARAAYRARSLG